MSSAIVNAIVEIEANGLSTRGSVETGRFLAICQRCVHYDHCAREPGRLAEKLCDAGYWCEVWIENSALGIPVSSK